jgi:hypothetical protein
MLDTMCPVAGHRVWDMRYCNYIKGVAMDIMDNYVNSHKIVSINQQVTVMLLH